ncbi:DNA cytosine methyltransferase [Sphingobium vermicomposti]|uniref:Cytosine-specific methyltransferase n=1 Tax=Sphingobium vermicomposti TaxID=529005 RepID=A0A846M4W7_9SPHN|nr:DNA (cytosine-5-)-methyltransferase [Sphingobium vermicomposti]NIJ15621.1 DNA (cytosine-5)-methyltransferase 1 [Sphingobium vermicomposti]
MRYIDICSGISAPTAAWKPLGWQALCYAEIEAAPRAVLAHHYPNVPLVGDFTQIKGTEYGPVDLLVGGTPCQSFSIAGLRGGLADDRGNLALEYLRLADRSRSRWLVWENVTGVLSSNEGRDFGAILGGMAELGYGTAYRVLDAKYFGVPQQRHRVIVVGYLGDWRPAAAVLFERQSLQGHPPPRPETPPPVAARAACGADPRRSHGDLARDSRIVHVSDFSRALTACSTATDRLDPNEMEFVADVAPCLDASFGRLYGQDNQHIDGGAGLFVASRTRVRRLTVNECERLQGFADDFTLVPFRGRMLADGPRYKMLGNSMPVPMMHWIGRRISGVEAFQHERLAA